MNLEKHLQVIDVFFYSAVKPQTSVANGFLSFTVDLAQPALVGKTWILVQMIVLFLLFFFFKYLMAFLYKIIVY